MIHLRIDDFCHVGPILGPKSHQLGRQWRHLGPQEPPTWPRRGFQELGAHDHFSQFLPRRPQRGGGTPWARGGKDRFWSDFGTDLNRLYNIFGSILTLIWDQILH